MTLIELEYKITEWADKRGLLKYGDYHKQLNKITEELGELASAVNKNKDEEFEKELGDLIIASMVLARMCRTNAQKCVSKSFAKIENREGELINGGYVKKEDL